MFVSVYFHKAITPASITLSKSHILYITVSIIVLSTNALVGVRRNTAFYYYRFKCATCLNCNGFFMTITIMITLPTYVPENILSYCLLNISNT